MPGLLETDVLRMTAGEIVHVLLQFRMTQARRGHTDKAFLRPGSVEAPGRKAAVRM